MIDSDVRKLVESEHASSDLSHLEAHVWQREPALQVHLRTTCQIARGQVVVMTAAMIGSTIAGIALTQHSADPRCVMLMMPGERLAPSSLPFGARL